MPETFSFRFPAFLNYSSKFLVKRNFSRFHKILGGVSSSQQKLPIFYLVSMPKESVQLSTGFFSFSRISKQYRECIENCLVRGIQACFYAVR